MVPDCVFDTREYFEISVLEMPRVDCTLGNLICLDENLISAFIIYCISLVIRGGFPLQHTHTNLDSSYKTDLDLWDSF